MAGKVNMKVARPAYARLLAAKAQLAAELGRDVTNDETIEALLRYWEEEHNAAAELEAVNAALIEGGISYPLGHRGVQDAITQRNGYLEAWKAGEVWGQ